MSRRIYRSYSDAINHRSFEAIVPVSYFRRISSQVDDEQVQREFIGESKYGIVVTTKTIGNKPYPTSFYNPVNPYQRERAFITIPDMVDLFIKKTFCEIISDLDIMHILHLIDGYLTEIEGLVQQRNETFVDFARRIISFRQEFVYPCFKRNLVKYPKLAEDYKLYNTGMSKGMLQIMNFGLNSPLTFTDGIDKLRHPPFDIDAYTDKKTNKKTVKDINGEDTQEADNTDFLNDIFKNWNTQGGNK